MINHARTLLLNRSGGNQNLRDLGEEFIPESFRSQQLPSWLESYRRVLLGSRPENVYANFQVDKLLRIIHATQFEPYLTLFDTRLTYDPRDAGAFSDTQYGYSLQSAIEKVTSVAPVSEVYADELHGYMRYRWSFVLANQVATVTSMSSGRTTTLNLVDPTAAGRSVSDVVTLPDTTFQVRFSIHAPYTVADWTDNFELTLLTRPTQEISEKVETLESLRDLEYSLFGTDDVEPYVTFYGLWRAAPSLPERITGIVLAIIYRLHSYYRAQEAMHAG